MIRFRAATATSMLAFAVSSASAQEPIQVVLEYIAPSGCSDRETFASGLRARSPRIRIGETNEGGWIVNVRMTPTDRGVHGELRLTYGKGDFELRAVEGVDCAEVVEALSLTAAMAIEQTVARSTSEATPTKSVAQPEPSSESRSNDTNLESRSRSHPIGGQPESGTDGIATPAWEPEEPGTLSGTQERERTRLSISGFVAQRVHPQTSLGVSLSLLRTLPIAASWSSEVGLGVFYVPSRVLQPNHELAVGYYGVALEGCPLIWTLGKYFTISPCALLDLVDLAVSDRTVDVSVPSHRMTASVGGRLRSRMQILPRLDLGLEFGLVTPLTPRQYVTGPSPENDTSAVEANVGHTDTIAWQLGIGWLVGL